MMKKFICLFLLNILALPNVLAQEPASVNLPTQPQAAEIQMQPQPTETQPQPQAAETVPPSLPNSDESLPSLDAPLSVEDCVRIAMAHSPQAVSARLAIETAAVALSSAKNVFLPTVSATANTGYYQTHQTSEPRLNETATSSSVGAEMSLSGITDMGRNIRSQRLKLEQSRMQLCEVENAIVAEVKSAYYALMAAQRAVEIRSQSRDLYQEQYDRTKAFYDQGLRPKVDVTTAEVNLNNEILSLIRAKNLVKTQNAKLANVLGVPRDTPFLLQNEIENEKIDFTFEEALTRAYENRPDVKSSKLGVQISEIKLTQSKAAYWPTFSMGAAFSKSGDEFRFDTEQTKLFAGVEIPIFSAFKVHNEVKQAQINLASSKNNDRSLANDVYLEVQSAFIRLNEAAESIPVAASTVERAQENMDLARGRYNEGIGDIITLKDAEVSYTDAKLNLLTARFDYAVALAELKKSMGTK